MAQASLSLILHYYLHPSLNQHGIKMPLSGHGLQEKWCHVLSLACVPVPSQLQMASPIWWWNSTHQRQTVFLSEGSISFCLFGRNYQPLDHIVKSKTAADRIPVLAWPGRGKLVFVSLLVAPDSSSQKRIFKLGRAVAWNDKNSLK